MIAFECMSESMIECFAMQECMTIQEYMTMQECMTELRVKPQKRYSAELDKTEKFQKCRNKKEPV
jgi:hypothetical protein